MAVLVKPISDSAHAVHLYVEHTIGRSAACKQIIRHKSVSGYHACISWHNGAWSVRDLGSRNGTYVNGQRVRERPHELRQNDRLVFGDQDETWVLFDDSAPRAVLIPLDGKPHGDDSPAPSLILDDLRAFPSDANPQTTIFQDAEGRFWLETADAEPCELGSEQQVSIGGLTYRVHLPGALQQGLTTTSATNRAVESSVRTMRLTLNVAPDEETAAAVVDAGAVQAQLQPRVHLYLLSHLARMRAADAASAGDADGPEKIGSGWVSVEILCDDLQLTREQLGLQVFRIRDDMKKVGLSDAGEIVDRSRRGWIRIGVPASCITLGRM